MPPPSPAGAPGAVPPPPAAGSWSIPGQPGQATGNNGLAIASLSTSLAGLFLGICCWVLWLALPVGAILGHVALSQIKTSGQRGRGLAIGGIAVGWGGLLLAIGLFVLFFSLSFTGTNM